MLGVKNIAKPTDPGMAWSSAIPTTPGHYLDKPDSTQDFPFSNDQELHIYRQAQ